MSEAETITVQEKRAVLAGKAMAGIPVRVLFFGARLADRGASKIKTGPLKQHLQRDPRFEVAEASSMDDLRRLYGDADLIVPVQPYLYAFYPRIPSMRDWMRRSLPLVHVWYSLGWHTDMHRQSPFDSSFMYCCDSADLCTSAADAFTGHPWAEVLNRPKDSFADPWRCDPGRRRVLVCPHHTTAKANVYGNASGFAKYAGMLLSTVERYGDRLEFAIRLHPNAHRAITGAAPSSDVGALLRRVRVCTDTDYVGWFKHSDALIHDCGSFRCEYLHVNKPVCYMANGTNANPAIWSALGRSAMQCHEMCWYDRGETLDGFVQRLLDGEDVKRDARMEHWERYCSPASYPNGRTPCENIVDAILGTGAYSGPAVAPAQVGQPSCGGK